MTENQKKKIEELRTALHEDECKELYCEIAEYAVKLGYLPSKTINAHGVLIAFAFTKSKVGKKLLRINVPHPADWNSGKGSVTMAYFAAEYSDFFREKVRQSIETGTAVCERDELCENCAGRYVYAYPDGKTTGRCAIHTLMELSPFGAEHLEEIKKMMRMQDVFWLKRNCT